MFEPVYFISDKLLKSIIEVETARTVTELIKPSDEWEVKFRIEALAKRAFGTLRFLGNNLAAPDILKILTYDPGRDEKASEVAEAAQVTAKESDVQMLLNWINANRYKEQLVYLAERFHQKNLGEKDLVQLNALFLEKMVNVDRIGIFRGDDEEGKATIFANKRPIAVEVSYQVEDFFQWLNSKETESLHPLMLAGVVLYELLRIDPFIDGNVLVAIMFTTLVLETRSYGFKGLLAYEEELLKNKDVFAMYLAEPEKKGDDLTVWLEFFVKGIAESGQKIRTKLLASMGETPTFRSESGRVVSLSERQVLIMEDLTLRGQTTIKEVRALLPSVSDDTILRDFKDLIEKKLVKKKGKTRGSAYVLGKIRGYR